MTIINLFFLILCAYYVTQDEPWTVAWWISGFGVVFNLLAVLTDLS